MLGNSPEKSSSKSSPVSACSLGHPDDVLHHRALSPAEKRSILASWASDAHAVVDAPTMRQLDNGAIVDLDVILRALRTLDGAEDGGETVAPRTLTDVRWWRSAGRHEAVLTRWRKRQQSARRHDDDDDPPPCPVSSAAPLPPRLVPAYGRLVA